MRGATGGLISEVKQVSRDDKGGGGNQVPTRMESGGKKGSGKPSRKGQGGTAPRVNVVGNGNTLEIDQIISHSKKS